MENKFIRICNYIFLLIILCISTASIVTSKTIVPKNIIYIDPGHGGPDGGAVGIDGLFEKDIVLNVSKKLKKYLNEAGYNVLLTRDGDYDLADDNSKNKKREDIHSRVKLINDSNCLLYVSIHANIFSQPSVYGAQCFYKANDHKSKLLSEEMQASLKALLQNTKREAKSISGKYLVEHILAPGTLIEIGFLSNPQEAKLLKDEFYQDKLAYAISVGILSYLEKVNS